MGMDLAHAALLLLAVVLCCCCQVAIGQWGMLSAGPKLNCLAKLIRSQVYLTPRLACWVHSTASYTFKLAAYQCWPQINGFWLRRECVSYAGSSCGA